MPDNARLLLLDRDQVERLMQPADVLEAVKQAFTLHSDREGRVFPVVRERLSTGGVFGIKSGDVQSQGLLGFKAAGFWPANRQVGGEPHQATVMLMDPANGRPVCMIDGNAITTMRTGAAGAWGVKWLARADSTRVCVFGTGVQAAVQLRFALDQLPSLDEVRYVTHGGKPNAQFEAAFAQRCRIEHATDANDAVARADLVITATPGAGALFDLDALQPGTHLNCVGADTKGKRELPEGTLARVKLVVDDREQARQIGETQWAASTPCTELGDLITGKETFERQASDITLFDMTGLALQDLTVARLLYERAVAQGVGSSIAWPW
ncbi:alanine dehydrogenase [Paraburkholderia sp. GAS199]|uniref:ornithine cyclodeaminase family protein n=1 Tax=Paraburkholderia sp. GAS199 TaxID=3035126 RepID=UPI003D222670